MTGVLQLSTFKNIRDTKPILHNINVGRLTHHKVRSDKDGPLYSPAIWRDGSTRGADGIDHLTAVVLDYDGNGADLQKVLSRLDGICTIWHTTHSNKPDHQKFRVILPLAEPSSLDVWTLVHNGAVELAGRDGLDPTCAEPSRAYYAPSCPEEHSKIKQAGKQDGRLLTIDELLEKSVEHHPVVDKPRAYGDGKPGDDYNASISWSDVLTPLGWTILFERNGVGHWQKPGGKGREHHATTNHGGSDCLYVFTPLAGLPTGQGLTKFAVHAHLNHGGNFSEAAKDLASKGYGTFTRKDDVLLQPKTNEVKVVNIEELLAHDFPPRENILTPWLPSQGVVMVYAGRGIGKTFFSLSVGLAVSSGGSFLKWQAKNKKGVLLLDGEMPGAVLQERAAAFIAAHDLPPGDFRIVTPDMQPDHRSIDLSRIEDQELIEQHLDGVCLIIVDNISTLCRTGRENEGEGWLPVQEWALRQRAKGRSVLFIHHAGKGGNQRGTSRREDILDTVIALRRPAKYSPDMGAVFEIHFEKSRGIYGEDVEPIEASLIAGDDGSLSWAYRSVDVSTYDKVVELLKEGLSITEVASELDVNKSTVSRHARKAKSEGDWHG